MRSLTLLDLALALRAATEANERFGWYTAPNGVPSGCYHLDRDNAALYIDGRLDVATGCAAIVAGIDDYLTGGADVIPLHRHLVAATFATLDGRAVEGLGGS